MIFEWSKNIENKEVWLYKSYIMNIKKYVLEL